MSIRLTAMGLAVLLSLSGCRFQQNTMKAKLLHRSINVAISRDLIELREIVVEGLLRPMKSISNGSFEINLRITDNPLESLDQGDEVVIMSNHDAALANGDFSVYTSPYYFRDYDHFAITMGHDNFYELTDEANLALLGAKPMGALYGGGYTFFSGKDEPIGELEGLQNNRIGLLPNSAFLETVFEDLESRVTVREIAELLEGFSNRTLPIIELPNFEVEQLRMPEKISQIYYNENFHRLDINWVMVSEKALAQWDEWELAVLTEGIASLVAYNDTVILEREDRNFQLMKQHCTTIPEPIAYDDFSALVEGILRRSYRYNNLWNWENYSLIKNIC